uniref:Uncharacterized protein n=1 Tax=Bracon brevicornis TaxID=1563983 RepID=A0A6V7M5K4_9HYME
MMSTTSVPIATSTPVNLPTTVQATSSGATPGPPPLSVNSSQVRASYPAVLKGRTGASPPIPNLVPSGKIPPPVPPRGTAKRPSISIDEQRGNISSSSSTSGRGDVNVAYCLHEKNIVPARSPLLHATHNLSSTFYRDNSGQYLGIGYYYPDNYISNFEREEFVLVEQHNDNYVIKRSPCPVRPDRRKGPAPKRPPAPLRIDRIAPSCSQSTNKFTQFLIPSSEPYKMSRKDKKHSETYAERMTRLRRESKKLKQNLSLGVKLQKTNSVVKPFKIIPTNNERKTNLDNPTKVRVKSFKIKIQKVRTDSSKPSLRRQVFDSLSSLTSTKNRTIVTQSSNSIHNDEKLVLEARRASFSSLRTPSPNVRMEAGRQPDTYKQNLSDDQYLNYLDDQMKCQALPASRNTSFLHGYK